MKFEVNNLMIRSVKCTNLRNNSRFRLIRGGLIQAQAQAQHRRVSPKRQGNFLTGCLLPRARCRIRLQGTSLAMIVIQVWKQNNSTKHRIASHRIGKNRRSNHDHWRIYSEIIKEFSANSILPHTLDPCNNSSLHCHHP